MLLWNIILLGLKGKENKARDAIKLDEFESFASFISPLHWHRIRTHVLKRALESHRANDFAFTTIRKTALEIDEKIYRKKQPWSGCYFLEVFARNSILEWVSGKFSKIKNKRIRSKVDFKARPAALNSPSHPHQLFCCLFMPNSKLKCDRIGKNNIWIENSRNRNSTVIEIHELAEKFMKNGIEMKT